MRRRKGLSECLLKLRKGDRFHVDIYWPQLNGNPRNAHVIADLFSSAQWDVTVRMAGCTKGPRLFFSFYPKSGAAESSRPPQSQMMIEVFLRAKIVFATD